MFVIQEEQMNYLSSLRLVRTNVEELFREPFGRAEIISEIFP